jgi:hypothetical protein
MIKRALLPAFFLLSVGCFAHATDNTREWDRSKADARDASREVKDIQRRDAQDADRAAYERLDRERAKAEAEERAKRGN